MPYTFAQLIRVMLCFVMQVICYGPTNMFTCDGIKSARCQQQQRYILIRLGNEAGATVKTYRRDTYSTVQLLAVNPLNQRIYFNPLNSIIFSAVPVPRNAVQWIRDSRVTSQSSAHSTSTLPKPCTIVTTVSSFSFVPFLPSK